MKNILALGLAVCLASSCTNKSTMPQEGNMTLKIVGTTDIHGCFLPYDYINDRDLKGTMGRVCSYVDSVRAVHGENMLFIDNGDILQGQPTNYFYNYIKTDVENIATEVLDFMRYDAVTPGNHDIEAGHAVYDKWIEELDCPVLAANIIDTKTGEPYTTPYLIKERQGVKIAILGMITPAIPSWLNEDIWSGMRFDGIKESTERWVKHLKDEERADIIICQFHCGWSGGIVADEYVENETEMVAHEVAGIDAIFYGHDHQKRVEQIVNNMGDTVLCINAGSHARSVSEVTIDLTFSDGKIATKTIKGELVDITGQPINEAFAAKFQPHADDIKAYASKEVGRITETINTRDCFFGSSAFCDLIHNLQLAISKADVSLCAPLSFNATIEAGPITVSDMFKLYKYENKLCILNMTGREIRNHLEMSYAIWTKQMTSPDDNIMLLQEKDESQDNRNSRFVNPTYNFDSAAGIDYEVDVTKPQGSKITIKQFTDGRAFNENETYKVVTNSYRANGGGELITIGAGIDKDSLASRIVYESDMDQRHLLMEEIERQGTITPRPNNNWRFVPEAWTKKAIERDRKLIFGE